MAGARSPRLAAALGLLAFAGCQWPHVQLPVKGDADVDDDDDETPVACSDESQCAGLAESLCHPRGYCVECVTADDCADGYVCDLEGECEGGR